MRRVFGLSLFLLIPFVFPYVSLGQTEEIRQATGLPIPIGAPVIYGRVTISGLRPGEHRPSLFVSLILSGAQIDRQQTNDDGYYYFLTMPRNGAALVFEANGSEVGRVILASGPGNTAREDISLDWLAVQQAGQKAAGVVSAKELYQRSANNQKKLDKAISASGDKHPEIASSLLKDLVSNDPNDFAAWTELGSVNFTLNNTADAESSYIKAIELKPDFQLALINLGKLYLFEKQPEKAVPVLLKAAAADQNSAGAFHYLGEAYLQAKLGSKAVIALNEAIRLAPDENADLHLRLAALYNAAGVKDRAANEYKLFLAKRPKYPNRQKLEKYIEENSKPPVSAEIKKTS